MHVQRGENIPLGRLGSHCLARATTLVTMADALEDDFAASDVESIDGKSERGVGSDVALEEKLDRPKSVRGKRAGEETAPGQEEETEEERRRRKKRKMKENDKSRKAKVCGWSQRRATLSCADTHPPCPLRKWQTELLSGRDRWRRCLRICKRII